MTVKGFATSWFYWGAWTLLGLFMATQDLMAWDRGITASLLGGLLLLNLGQNLTWGLLSLLTIWVTLRFPLNVHPPARNWLTHLLASLVIVPVGMALMAAMAFLHTPPKGPLLEDFLKFVSWYVSFEYLVCYWGVVGLHEGFQVLRQYREESLQVSLLEARLTEARLQSLQVRLNPHFLFNALNTLSALLNSHPERAEHVLIKLSQFLRASLKRRGDDLTTLGQEVRSMEDYINLERFRFDEELNVSIEIPEMCQEALVPSFILQPLLENAFKHGLAGGRRGGMIRLRANREQSALVVEVQDNGRGTFAQGEATQGTHLGLQITRARLERHFGTDQEFQLEFLPEGGAVARIRLPFIHPQDDVVQSFTDEARQLRVSPYG